MTSVLKSGTIVAGRYRVVRLGWPTAIGPVWHAKDLVLDRDVLLHSLAPDLASHDEARAAFTACASKAAQVGGPHVAQVYDCGGEPPYLVTELPGGGRVAERLADGRMSLAETARVVTGVAAALKALHEHGHAHGAVGPAWIGLDEEGRAKLLGIGAAEVAGIARAVRDAPLDPPLLPAGYPDAGADALADDARSLAAVALHALTGRAPGEAAARGTGLRTGIPAAVSHAIERVVEGAAGAKLEDLVVAFAPHAAPHVPAEREPGFLRTEGKWLVAVGAFLALGVAAVIGGLAIGKLTPGQSAGPTTSPGPTGAGVSVAAVSDFDPQGNGEEHPDQTDRAFDDNPTTAWFTVGYKTANLGGEKKGVGLVFDLGAARRVGSIRVLTPFAGWQAEWRTAESLGATPESFKTVATFTAANESIVPIEGSGTARYWLLWVTRLTDSGAGGPFPFQAAVAEATFEAP